jgi:transitional endoplasmic reticulum ATPase
VLDDLCVSRDDFNSALKRVQPSAMREVMVQVPNVALGRHRRRKRGDRQAA